MTPREEAAAAFRNATREFADADNAWGAELVARFGRDACNIRYLPAGHGEPGTHLRRLHDAREDARLSFERVAAVWLAAGRERAA